MARGPNGEWRPAGDGPCAIHVMKVLTGQIPKDYQPTPGQPADPDAAQKRASSGGKARAASLTPKRRSEIARDAASARWDS